MVVSKQFRLLLWKNYILKKRNIIITILEILLPLMFIGILIWLRLVIKSEKISSIMYKGQSIEELPLFFQSPPKDGVWELIYIPSNSDVVKNIAEEVKKTLSIDLRVRGFLTEDEFKNYVQYEDYASEVLAAVVFDHIFLKSDDPLPLKVKYCLRFNYSPRNPGVRRILFRKTTTGWHTSTLFPLFPTVGPREASFPDGGNPGYIREGFLAVQYAVDKAIMRYHAPEAAKSLFDKITLIVKRFPYPAYTKDPFLTVVQFTLPLILVLAFTFTVLNIIRVIVHEKEKKLKLHCYLVFFVQALLTSLHLAIIGLLILLSILNKM